jgi:poly-gamma-glutamate synthesis protein (capsule biosynthesis protein)
VGIDEVLDPTYMMAGQDRPGTAAGHDFGLALRAVRQAAARADIVVVMIHWGVELDTQPRAYRVEEAHRMIDAGAGRSSTAWATSSGPTCPRRAPRRAWPRSG